MSTNVRLRARPNGPVTAENTCLSGAIPLSGNQHSSYEFLTPRCILPEIQPFAFDGSDPHTGPAMHADLHAGESACQADGTGASGCAAQELLQASKRKRSENQPCYGFAQLLEADVADGCNLPEVTCGVVRRSCERWGPQRRLNVLNVALSDEAVSSLSQRAAPNRSPISRNGP